MRDRQSPSPFHSINLSGGKWEWSIVAGEDRQELAQARIECKRTWIAACRALSVANSANGLAKRLSLTRRFNWPSGISSNQVVRFAVGGKLGENFCIKLDGQEVEVAESSEASVFLSNAVPEKLAGQRQLEIVLDPAIFNSRLAKNPVAGAWIRIES